MANDSETPEEAAEKRLTDLKAQAAPEIEGIRDKLSGAFWDKVRGFFATMFEGVWQDYLAGAPDLFSTAIQAGIIWGAPVADTDVTRSIGEILRDETDPDIILEKLEHFTEQFAGFDTIYKMLHFIICLFGMLSASMVATKELAGQSVLAKRRPSLIPPEAAIDAQFKDPDLRDTVIDTLSRYGIGDDLQELLFKSAETPLGPGDARSAWLRGFIEETDFVDLLRANHFSDADIETITKLAQVLPPVQDIITMAVREVFSPEIVEKFGQMEGLPEDFVKWAAQQGLSGDWASAYWAAHWSLPSVGQGFEMRHRDVIADDELGMLLKALDIMPFWREKLKEISYRPLTRVDVRRMYALGVLDEAKVMRSYLDIGYNEENALLMTQFTVAYTAGAEKELSKGDIIALYKKNAIDGNAATDMLQKLGYSYDSATLLVARAAYEIYAAYKKKKIGYIQRAYVAGKITEGVALGMLGGLDLPASEMSQLMDTWDLDRASKVRNLTIDNLKAFFAAGVINQQELASELQELGYNNVDTSRFIALFSLGGST